MKEDLTTIRQTKVELDNVELTEAILDYIQTKLKVDTKNIQHSLFFINLEMNSTKPKVYKVIVDFNTKTNKEGVWKKKK